VTLSEAQRIALRDIVVRIEQGDIAPRVPGEVGWFLRNLGQLRAKVSALLPHDGNFVQGAAIGDIHLVPLAPLTERIESELLGEVASTIAVSEELAGLVDVTLWSRGRSANRLLNIWLREPSEVSMAGSYRWYPPRRITPGTAQIEESRVARAPWDRRCLRYVAEEFLSAPTAVEYRWDTAHGPLDLRTFRVTVLHAASGEWMILPGEDDRLSRALRVAPAPDRTTCVHSESRLALAMLARDPWVDKWSIVAAEPIDADGALGHLLTWADHRRELLGLPSPAASEVTEMQRMLASLGFMSTRDGGIAAANVVRAVLPTVRSFAAWTRGLV
jgi:hypothetical protein